MLSHMRNPFMLNFFRHRLSLPACSLIKQKMSHSSEIISIKQLRKNLALVGNGIAKDAAAGRIPCAPDRPQSELPVRRMQDSFCQALIPLLTDEGLKKKYLTVFRSVRFGRLLEDMDSFAGWICYLHVKGDREDGWIPHFMVVTAGVDRIVVRQGSIAGDADILMQGMITWVGTSSMEVTIRLLQNGKELLEAKFLMVARHPTDYKAAIVNPLAPTTLEEERLFEAGEKARLKRQKETAASLLKVIPRGQEVEDIHKMFLDTVDSRSASFRSRVLPPESVWMEETTLKSAIMCHPEEKNVHGKVFGGFLMRQSYELAFINALTFAKSRPMILAVDDIHFRVPVNLGALLYMSSQIGFTSDNKMQVKVHTEVVDPVRGDRQTSNIFHFTFAATNSVRHVIPKSYAEAMMFIDSRRHFDSDTNL